MLIRFSNSLLNRCSSSANRRTFSGSMIAWAIILPFVRMVLSLHKHTRSECVLPDVGKIPGSGGLERKKRTRHSGFAAIQQNASVLGSIGGFLQVLDETTGPPKRKSGNQ